MDLFPDLSREALDARLTGDLRRFPLRSAARGLEGLLPARLLDRYARALGAEGETPAGQLPRAARLRLVELLKETCLTVTGTRALEYGEVTAGGVEWSDIDPATMESRLSPGLFFAGEILDLAGRCGGFNLQAAFSTGFLAGHSAARRARGAS